jgi:hypothetical protein
MFQHITKNNYFKNSRSLLGTLLVRKMYMVFLIPILKNIICYILVLITKKKKKKIQTYIS